MYSRVEPPVPLLSFIQIFRDDSHDRRIRTGSLFRRFPFSDLVVGLYACGVFTLTKPVIRRLVYFVIQCFDGIIAGAQL